MKKIILLSFLMILSVFPQQWIELNKPTNTFGGAVKVNYLNENTWFVFSYDGLWKTTDGSKSFTNIIQTLYE